MEQLYLKVQSIFDRHMQPVPDFVYNEKTKEYVAVDGYHMNDVDYTVVIKPTGHVVYGLVEGNTFYEEDTLGYV